VDQRGRLGGLSVWAANLRRVIQVIPSMENPLILVVGTAGAHASGVVERRRLEG
jgi:hypothetical protein